MAIKRNIYGVQANNISLDNFLEFIRGISRGFRYGDYNPPPGIGFGVKIDIQLS